MWFRNKASRLSWLPKLAAHLRGGLVGLVIAGVWLWAGSGEASAQDSGTPSLGQLARALQNDPTDRQARWALSQAAFAAGRTDIARYHVRELVKTSTSRKDLATLTAALAKITQADPWDLSLSVGFLPSTNIYRYSYNDSFETALGIFTPTGGGQAKSGVGLTLGARASYALSLPDASQLSFTAQLGQNLYGISDLNRTSLRLSARRDVYALGHMTSVAPYVRFRLDHSQSLERRDIGASVTRVWWRDEGREWRLSARAEERRYLHQSAFSGPYGRVDLGYGFDLAAGTRLEFGAALARSKPRADHLKYWEGQLSAQVTRRVSGLGTLGLFGTLTARRYDGTFPATPFSRRDDSAAIGLSYTPERFKIMGVRPKLSCQYHQNRSNIALYAFKTTDCGISFIRRF